MLTRFFPAVFSGLVATVITLGVSAPAQAGNRIVLYSNPGNQGDSFEVSGAGEFSNLNRKSRRGFKDWDDTISSIEFNGAFKLTLFRDKDFSGGSIQITATTRAMFNLNGQDWDNKVTSIKWEPIGNEPAQPQAIFYDRPNFMGNSFILYPGESIARLKTKRRGSRWKNFNDEIRSVALVGSKVSVVLFRDERYEGPKVTITKSTPTLDSVGFVATASSLAVK